MVAMRALMVGVLGVALMRPVGTPAARRERGSTSPRDVLNVTLAGLQSGVALQSPRGIGPVRSMPQPEVDARAS